jgi:hypothetical protein
VLSSSDGEAKFWEIARDVNSKPLEGEGVSVKGNLEFRGGKRAVPNEPEETFCCGVFFCFELVSGEGL